MTPDAVHEFLETDGRVSVFAFLPGALAGSAQARGVFEELQALPDEEWIQGTFMQHKVPRLVRWHALGGGSYKFSGRRYESTPYTRKLRWFQTHTLPKLLHKMLPKSRHFKFHQINSVLVNKYRSNADSISPHCDNETEFGREPTIVSVNFGASRRFVLRPMTPNELSKECKRATPRALDAAERKRRRFVVTLGHGDVFVMAGAAQDFWYHEVPKEKAPSDAVRFNLTFRPYEPDDDDSDWSHEWLDSDSE